MATTTKNAKNLTDGSENLRIPPEIQAKIDDYGRTRIFKGFAAHEKAALAKEFATVFSLAQLADRIAVHRAQIKVFWQASEYRQLSPQERLEKFDSHLSSVVARFGSANIGDAIRYEQEMDDICGVARGLILDNGMKKLKRKEVPA
jgi:hypothetical protein